MPQLWRLCPNLSGTDGMAKTEHIGSLSEFTRGILAEAQAAGFALAGVATKDDLVGVPPEADPEAVLPGFRAVVVLAATSDAVVMTSPTGPVMLADPGATGLTRIRASLEVEGWGARPLGGGEVSLPRLAAAAGLGKVSPVGALVAAGRGLRLVLFALATDAPLASTGRGAVRVEPVGRSGPRSGAGEDCLECFQCTQDCPAMLTGTFSLRSCTACGACVATCPS